MIHSQTEMYLYDLYLFPLFHHALLGKKRDQLQLLKPPTRQ